MFTNISSTSSILYIFATMYYETTWLHGYGLIL